MSLNNYYFNDNNYFFFYIFLFKHKDKRRPIKDQIGALAQVDLIIQSELVVYSDTQARTHLPKTRAGRENPIPASARSSLSSVTIGFSFPFAPFRRPNQTIAFPTKEWPQKTTTRPTYVYTKRAGIV